MALPRAQAIAASRAALIEVAHLTGKTAESVTALRHDGRDWVLEIDVVELHRTPDTTDILATYRVHLDDHGDLLAMRRGHHFVRTATDNRS